MNMLEDCDVTTEEEMEIAGIVTIARIARIARIVKVLRLTITVLRQNQGQNLQITSNLTTS